MPTYDYRCSKCNYSMEALQKITDAPLTLCPQCGQESLLRGPGGGIGLQFHGSGFYITDYASPSKDSAPKSSGCCPCGKNSNNCGG